MKEKILQTCSFGGYWSLAKVMNHNDDMNDTERDYLVGVQLPKF